MNPEPGYVCGDPSLDFVSTLRARHSAPVDTIGSPDRLERWLLGSGLVDRVVEVAEVDVVGAQRLREAIHTLAIRRLADEPADEPALALLNAIARQPAAVPQLRGWERWTECTAAEALAMIARRAVELVGGSEAALLKECASPDCAVVFLDRSRGARRQWCCMAGCGSRVKSAAYRSRTRERAGADH